MQLNLSIEIDMELAVTCLCTDTDHTAPQQKWLPLVRAPWLRQRKNGQKINFSTNFKTGNSKAENNPAITKEK
jgi:hypothetical protein